MMMWEADTITEIFLPPSLAPFNTTSGEGEPDARGDVAVNYLGAGRKPRCLITVAISQ
jgi:hypothetical protein